MSVRLEKSLFVSDEITADRRLGILYGQQCSLQRITNPLGATDIPGCIAQHLHTGVGDRPGDCKGRNGRYSNRDHML